MKFEYTLLSTLAGLASGLAIAPSNELEARDIKIVVSSTSENHPPSVEFPHVECWNDFDCPHWGWDGGWGHCDNGVCQRSKEEALESKNQREPHVECSEDYDCATGRYCNVDGLCYDYPNGKNKEKLALSAPRTEPHVECFNDYDCAEGRHCDIDGLCYDSYNGEAKEKLPLSAPPTAPHIECHWDGECPSGYWCPPWLHTCYKWNGLNVQDPSAAKQRGPHVECFNDYDCSTGRHCDIDGLCHDSYNGEEEGKAARPPAKPPAKPGKPSLPSPWDPYPECYTNWNCPIWNRYGKKIGWGLCNKKHQCEYPNKGLEEKEEDITPAEQSEPIHIECRSNMDCYRGPYPPFRRCIKGWCQLGLTSPKQLEPVKKTNDPGWYNCKSDSDCPHNAPWCGGDGHCHGLIEATAKKASPPPHAECWNDYQCPDGGYCDRNWNCRGFPLAEENSEEKNVENPPVHVERCYDDLDCAPGCRCHSQWGCYCPLLSSPAKAAGNEKALSFILQEPHVQCDFDSDCPRGSHCWGWYCGIFEESKEEHVMGQCFDDFDCRFGVCLDGWCVRSSKKEEDLEHVTTRCRKNSDCRTRMCWNGECAHLTKEEEDLETVVKAREGI